MFNRDRRELEKKLDAEGRLPPGQSLTLKFPVLHYGPVPKFDPATWTLRAFGLVAEEKSWSWPEFQKLPTTKITCDIHCVTRWSKFDTVWEGVPFRNVAKLAGVKPEAKFVIAHSEYGFTTSLPLEVMLEDDVLLAYELDGAPLPSEHVGPMRLVVPHVYGCKSAKFLSKLKFQERDTPGFWEVRGYHDRGDPWSEERLR